MDDPGRQQTPVWMDVPPPRPHIRTGATSQKGSGLNTILFFAGMALAVGLAGVAGIALWGPDKTVKNRSTLASNPPPPMAMPSLASAEPPPAPPVATDAPSAASAEAAPADPAGAKKLKKAAPHPKGKRH